MANDKKLTKLRNIMGKFHDESQNDGSENRRRIMDVNFSTLRTMAHKNVLVNGIIKKRCDQMKPYLRVVNDEEPRGFRVVKKGGDNKNDKRAIELQEFFLDTGFEYDSEREDDLIDFTEMVIRETLTIDQLAVEMRRTNGGDVFDFWLLDGATVRRTMDDKHKYVQRIQLPVTSDSGSPFHEAFFTQDDMIFEYMNKRADVRYRGFGYSALEQSIDIVTTFLFGINYNRDLFVKEKIPKGFLKIMGDADPSTVASVQRYWKQQMEGYGAKFKIPVIPSGKDGVGIDFQSLGQSNREMEYQKLINLIMSLQALPFGIDLAELGIKTENHQQMIGESGFHRMQFSKDSGIGSLLMYLENLFNKILMKVDKDYEFKFYGIKDDDKEKDEKIKKARLETTATINELRKEDGLEPIDEDYANQVLNPQSIQIYMADKSAKQMEDAQGGEEDEEGDNYEDYFNDNEDEEEADTGASAEDNADDEGEGQEAQKSITYRTSLMKSKQGKRRNKVLVI